MNKLQQALEVVEHYFQATYRADSEVLFRLFHQQAAVSGFINGEFQNWVAKDFRFMLKPAILQPPMGLHRHAGTNRL